MSTLQARIYVKKWFVLAINKKKLSKENGSEELWDSIDDAKNIVQATSSRCDPISDSGFYGC